MERNCFLISFFLALTTVSGDGPTPYKAGDTVDVEAYKLVSSLTLLTYDYYDAPFCRPEQIKFKSSGYSKSRLNVMETSNSLYDIKVGQNLTCEELVTEEKSCTRLYTQEELASFVDLISKRYRSHFIVDGVPVSIFHTNPKTKRVKYEAGVPIGAQGLDGTIYLYNHFDFRFHYAKKNDGFLTIDSVEVIPGSIDASYDDGKLDERTKCFRGTPLVIGKKWKPVESKRIQWTYTVEWIEKTGIFLSEDRIRRYDIENTTNIRWMSMLNTAVISLFSCIILAIFLSYLFSPGFSLNTGSGPIEILKTSSYIEREVRIVRYTSKNSGSDDSDNDASTYFDDNDADDYDDSTGKNKNALTWKHLTRDILTVPSYPLALSLLVGIGLQCFVSFCAVACAFALGYVEATDTKALLSILGTTMYTLGSIISGFYTGRLCKAFKVKKFILSILLNMILLPAILLCLSYVLQGSYKYFIPFITALEYLSKKLLLTSPITGICHCIGRKLPSMCSLRSKKRSDDIKTPSDPNSCSFFSSPLLNNAVSAVFPFGAKFIGIYFTVSTLWSYQVMEIGALVMHLVIGTLVVSSSVNIASVCFDISCNKAHLWWWSSFKIDVFSGLYTGIFVLAYFKNKITFADPTSKTIYFTYTFFAIVVHSIMAAAVSFIITFVFMRKVTSKKRKREN